MSHLSYSPQHTVQKSISQLQTGDINNTHHSMYENICKYYNKL